MSLTEPAAPASRLPVNRGRPRKELLNGLAAGRETLVAICGELVRARGDEDARRDAIAALEP